MSRFIEELIERLRLKVELFKFDGEPVFVYHYFVDSPVPEWLIEIVTELKCEKSARGKEMLKIKSPINNPRKDLAVAEGSFVVWEPGNNAIRCMGLNSLMKNYTTKEVLEGIYGDQWQGPKALDW